MTAAGAPRLIPIWLKIAFTVFMAVLVPVYCDHYGPTNFLYFCDVALFLTLAGIWLESALLISMCCVGILLPQALWCVDYLVVLCGGKLTGMTNYMVSDSPLFLRGLSLFHGWLPFLLVYLVLRTGYDRRAFLAWTGLAWVLCMIAYFLLPAPYAAHPGDLTPKNVNFVFGMDEEKVQTLMPPLLYLFTWMALLTVMVYWPAHWLLRTFVPRIRARAVAAAGSPSPGAASGEPGPLKQEPEPGVTMNPCTLPAADLTDGEASARPATPRGFWNLMFTQFQGAFSDNALKWLVIFLLFDMNFSKEEQASKVAMAGVVFAVPFLLFSMWAGWLSDRFSKRSVMMGVKLAEVAIMLFAALGLWMNSFAVQMTAICLMGVHSAVFAPAKYGILPEILPPSRLSWGNGILELLTFVAIIAGTVTGGLLAHYLKGRQVWSGLLLAALAVVGFFTSVGSPKVTAADPGKRFDWFWPATLWRQMAAMRRDRDLWRANWGNTWFFYVAALVQLNLALFAQQDFGLKETEQSWLQAALCLGIGAGSAFTGHFSHGRIAYGFIPLGAALMTMASVVMGLHGVGQGIFTGALAALGFGSGMFIVPVAAVLQHRPAAAEKGAVQGVASWLSWVGIVLASVTLDVLGKSFGLSHGQIFWYSGACALAAGIYVAWTRRGAIQALFQHSPGQGH